MKNSWGLALWEVIEGHWRRCNLRCSWWPRTEGVRQRIWCLAPWREPMRGYWWSLVGVENPSVLKMPEPWDTCWGKLLTGSRTSPGESSLLQSTKMEKGVEIWRLLWHQPWRCRVWNLPSWFPALLWGLQLSDWMNLRRDFELWAFYIVETVIDYRDF